MKIWLDEGFFRKALVIGQLRLEVRRSTYSKRYTFAITW